MTPLAIFAFRRPEHLRRLLASVAACLRLDECAIAIYCDGPCGPDDAVAIEATRVVAREWASAHGARVVECSENAGLARSIVGEVTALCAQHGRVIVLEDDLEVSPDFLRFMLAALDYYEDAGEVLQVSGYMFPVDHPGESDALILPLATTWGWATWARAWNRFSWEPAGARTRLADEDCRRRFNLDDSYDYSALLEARLDGRNDSWGVLWQWAVFESGGVVVHPLETLVHNLGFDGSGTHCGDGTQARPAAFAPLRENPRWPEVRVDPPAFDRVKKYLRQHRPAKPPFRPMALFSNLINKAREVFAPAAGGPTIPGSKEPDTAIYWDPKMAEILETWGEGNTWDEIQEMLSTKSGKVLDIACGTGKTMDILKRFPALEIHGCDISDFLLKKAAERGIAPERLTACDATKLPYAAATFACSYSIGSLEHFSEQGIRDCAAEAARVSRDFSAHMVPVARSGRNEGWMKTIQSFHNNSVEWWLEKFRVSFPVVEVIDSRWNDKISLGKWFICRKS